MRPGQPPHRPSNEYLTFIRRLLLGAQLEADTISAKATQQSRAAVEEGYEIGLYAGRAQFLDALAQVERIRLADSQALLELVTDLVLQTCHELLSSPTADDPTALRSRMERLLGEFHQFGPVEVRVHPLEQQAMQNALVERNPDSEFGPMLKVVSDPLLELGDVVLARGELRVGTFPRQRLRSLLEERR